MLVTGTVPLTEALTERLGKGKPEALEPTEVIPYLTKELHWRIQTVRFYLLRGYVGSILSP
jgi:tyrosinase